MAKTTHIQIRVSEEEKGIIAAAAKAEGQSVSDFMLGATLDKATAKRRRMTPYVKIGDGEMPVRDVLKLPVVMRWEEKE